MTYTQQALYEHWLVCAFERMLGYPDGPVALDLDIYFNRCRWEHGSMTYKYLKEVKRGTKHRSA
jgi:hypothetical protein